MFIEFLPFGSNIIDPGTGLQTVLGIFLIYNFNMHANVRIMFSGGGDNGQPALWFTLLREKSNVW
jgi:hypothetical protein